MAYWKNIPLAVWEYTIGGYQLLKKWLSYREGIALNRPITIEESQQFREIVRRIAAILLFGDQLDANYEAVKHQSYHWDNNEGE